MENDIVETAISKMFSALCLRSDLIDVLVDANDEYRELLKAKRKLEEIENEIASLSTDYVEKIMNIQKILNSQKAGE